MRIRGFTATIGGLLRRKSKLASFGVGIMNGLLPCGLVYAALALATASGNVFAGALHMGVFGLATIPALVIVASAGCTHETAVEASLKSGEWFRGDCTGYHHDRTVLAHRAYDALSLYASYPHSG